MDVNKTRINMVTKIMDYRPDNPFPCENTITETILADGVVWRQGDSVWYPDWETDDEGWVKFVNGEPVYYPETCQPYACVDDKGNVFLFYVNESGGITTFLAKGSFSTKEGAEFYINNNK